MFNILQKSDKSATVQTGMNTGITTLKSLKWQGMTNSLCTYGNTSDIEAISQIQTVYNTLL